MTPIATAARFPSEYGQSADTMAEHLPWEEVAQRIVEARNYWLATTTDAGEPHLRPVDGVFLDTTLTFGGSPETRWVRNLQQRPVASASLPDDEHAVILYGPVELVTDAEQPLARAVGPATVAKYPQYFPDGVPDFRPFWALRPKHVLAWSLSEFPNRATRFDFGAS